MSYAVLNEALATPGSNGTCTVSYSGLLYHSTYTLISRAAVRKSDPDTSFLDTSCLSIYFLQCSCPMLSNPHECCERYSSLILSSQSLYVFFFPPLLAPLLYPVKRINVQVQVKLDQVRLSKIRLDQIRLYFKIL